MRHAFATHDAALAKANRRERVSGRQGGNVDGLVAWM